VRSNSFSARLRENVVAISDSATVLCGDESCAKAVGGKLRKVNLVRSDDPDVLHLFRLNL
jgi:hypothetical protein